MHSGPSSLPTSSASATSGERPPTSCEYGAVESTCAAAGIPWHDCHRHPREARIRLRMALHAGEFGEAVNLAFRLLDRDTCARSWSPAATGSAAW
ncbi:hypothetical protein AOZ06_43110 [Kibdelosporangium phytohabitans]|uniref:Uncharacterized protein n=1 Tax=Kibdelosporangium phytohabitans TaxID=860235 RepID=A0A0N9HZK5_9PSEU|nr:hypothetical protein AOZ06_43110 [Kibdelosporangium phytohabitans]